MGRNSGVRLCHQLLARGLLQQQHVAAASQAQLVRYFSAQPEPVQQHGPVHAKEGKVLHPDLINANMKKTQYAVRGELYLKAEQLKKAGREIIMTNGGCTETLNSAARQWLLHQLTLSFLRSWQPSQPRS